MQLKIITPEKVVFEGEIDELIVPTVNGEIAVLPHHADLLTQVSEGEMTVKFKGKMQHIAVTGGFLEVQKDTLSLLSDFAIRSEEIDAKKALEARQRAEEVLKQKGEQMSERDFAIAQADIRRAVLELKVANKRRSHHTGQQNF